MPALTDVLLYHVVDGQQRLTTFVIFVQAFAELFASLPENAEKPPSKVFVNDSLRLSDLHERYLFRTNPKGCFRTYMFGYTDDNPSHEYLRHRILGESGGGPKDERRASALQPPEGMSDLSEIRKL